MPRVRGPAQLRLALELAPRGSLLDEMRANTTTRVFN
jgi:hypothetical protein